MNLSEDDLHTFEGWLKFQAINLAVLTDDEARQWRELFDEATNRRQSTPKVGRMKLKPMRPGEYRYAVALRDAADLWITLWIRRSGKGEIFVFQPRADRGP